MNQPCSTCGDSYKQKQNDRESIRQQAILKAKNEQKAMAICKENDSLTIYEASAAFATNQVIIEIVH